MSIIQKNLPSSQSPSTINLKKKKVLVVEDFFNFRLTIRRMLRSFNISDIDEAADGEEAVKKMSYKKYDIILCDYNLGTGKDGQHVLEEAKYRGYMDYSAIFMMVTALNTTDMVMGALEYQPDDYLIKPFTKVTLEKKLKNSIKKKANLKNIERAVERNDYAKAIALCDELISSNTKNLTELLKLKGEILTKKGDYTDAAVFYDEVLSMGNLPWAMLGLGKIKFITGDYNTAKGIFEKIIAKNDKNVAAYDWLAFTHEKMGNLKEAQKVLQEAIHISPKAILRQKALGNIAYKNKDLLTAEYSFKEAVKQGKHSFFKSPSDYTSLAKVFVDKNAPEEGLKVLSDAGREFTNNPEAALQISVTESIAFKKMNREKEARKALAKATQLSTTLSNKLPPNVELDLAKAFFLTGNEESGKAIIQRLIQSNHEDQELISDVQAVFKDLNIADKGRDIISMARNEIIKLNNEGVRLVKEGNLSKAIDFFEQAADNLPANKVINANAAHALILYMQKNGSKPLYLRKAMRFLDRVKNIDPAYKDLENLMKMYNELSREE